MTQGSPADNSNRAAASDAAPCGLLNAEVERLAEVGGMTPWDEGRVYVVPDVAEAFRRLGLTRFEDFLASISEADPEIQAAWKQVYQAPERHWMLYELAEKLVDLEDYFRRWRFNHVTTVERIIGFKRGTGGTAGVSYLKAMLEIELFPELWHVRTSL